MAELSSQAEYARTMSDLVVTRFKQPQPTYFFRAWRRYRGLTQQQLADRVDMSVSSISQLETGKQGFTDSTLLAIAHALNVEPGDLLSRDPAMDGQIVDLLRLIKQKGGKTALDVAIGAINGLPDRTGTDG